MNNGILHSEFADDPEMAELLELFIENLPGRITNLEKAHAARDLPTLHGLAHQLKGVGGGYGFQVITDQAAVLEQLLKEGKEGPEVDEAYHALVHLCRRACGQTQG